MTAGATQASSPRAPGIRRPTPEQSQSVELFENLDRIATVEMRAHGMPRGVVRRLYETVRARSVEPLTLSVGRQLMGCVGERVAIFTGILNEDLPVGEVDGPVGAALLADALTEIGAVGEVYVPEAMLGLMAEIRTAINGRFEIYPGTDHARDVYALLATEKLGRNGAGIAHSVHGAPIAQDFDVDDLFDEFNRTGKLTIAIGDGGNEVGFGTFFDEVREFVPRGKDCGCGCGLGIVTTTSAQWVLPCAISNTGAYALVSALAVLSSRPELAISPDRVASAISAAVEFGAVDGGTFRPYALGDDGVPLDAVKATTLLMRTIVEQAFRVSPRA
jgi:hypothetical protein